MNKSNKYTEGPWAIDRDSDRDDQGKGYTWIVSTSEDEAIAMVSANLYPDEIFKFNSANAYLIAAAPDLLEAATHAVGRLITSMKYGPDMKSSADVCIDDAINLLTEAIAKAKGGNNE